MVDVMTRSPEVQATGMPNVAGGLRPQVIESPRYTADILTWPSYEAMAAGGADIFEQGGTWYRRVYRHDPERKRVGPDGVVRVPRVPVLRRVFLTQQDAIANAGDFWMVDPEGGLTYGVRGVWMRGGVKPERDPALYFASQRKPAEIVEAGDEEWEPVSPAEQAQFQIEQDRLRKATPLSPIAAEPAVTAARRRGEAGRE